MPGHRAAGPVLATALLLLAGLIALGGFIDLFAEARKPQQAASPPGDPGVQRFAAFELSAWPTAAPTPVPPPPTEPPPAADDTGDVSPPPEAPAPPPAPVPASEPDTPVISEYQDYGMADGALAAINAARAAQGIGPLSANSQLAAAAQSYAHLLTELDTLSHDLNGGLLVRLQASGYAGGFLGEALWEGWGPYAADAVVSQWLNSPPHRDILLNAGFLDAGVACYVRVIDGALNTRCVLDVGG